MKAEARVFAENGQFLFDIVDLDCILEVDGDELPELLFTSPKTYSRESACDKAGEAKAREFSRASASAQRKLSGYDPAGQCGHPSCRTGFRAANRNTPFTPRG
jgi:hypothetical protein